MPSHLFYQPSIPKAPELESFNKKQTCLLQIWNIFHSLLFWMFISQMVAVFWEAMKASEDMSQMAKVTHWEWFFEGYIQILVPGVLSLLVGNDMSNFYHVPATMNWDCLQYLATCDRLKPWAKINLPAVSVRYCGHGNTVSARHYTHGDAVSVGHCAHDNAKVANMPILPIFSCPSPKQLSWIIF